MVSPQPGVKDMKTSKPNFKRRTTKGVLAALGFCCLMLAGAQAARADEVTLTGSTSGSFADALGANTGSSLLDLTFNGGSFYQTTAGGGATLALGSFYLAPPADQTLDPYTGSHFTLVITFATPTGIAGGQAATFTATLTGTVVNTPLLDTYSINVKFDNPVQTFTYTMADGSTGAFTLTVNDVNGITPNFTRALTGTVSTAAQSTAAATPEPATLVLFSTGLAGAGVAARKRRRAEGAS
jgi:hypothetical protein